MPSASVFTTVRKFAVGTMVVLYQIDLTALGAGINYFTNNVFEERVPISFGGHTYVHLPIAMEGIDTSAEAGPPQPRLTIATSGGPVNALIRNYGDLRGAKVTRVRTFAEFLDDMPDGEGGVIVNPGADPAAYLPVDLFIIDRKVSANNTMAEFQLVAPTDQDGIQLPLRTVKKRYCDKVYRFNNGDGTFTYTGRHNPCPWGNVVSDGGHYFTVDDATTSAANDRCSKTLTGCSLRFGKGAGLPFGGFPGVKAAGEAG
jgi:lambda family phage minor tail protein L